MTNWVVKFRKMRKKLRKFMKYRQKMLKLCENSATI